MGCNKLGMHIHGMKPGIVQAVELLQPRTITMMDPTPQELRDIYAVASPMAVVRKYEDGKNFQQVDPRWWAEEYYRMVGDAVSDRLIALGMNEPFGHDAQPLCAPFDEWNRAFIERCRELGPMDGGALAMATGNWTGADDRYRVTEDFPLTCGIAKFFLPHEYCWPTLEVGVPWYTLRYRAWIEDLEAIGRDDFLLIISEAGLTQAIIAGRPDHGYRSGGPEGVTEDSYLSTIDWYNARLCEDWRVLGCCLYDWAGSHYGWETFEQLGLEQRIFQIQAPEPPEPPEPPNGGDSMIPDYVKIYDFDHGPHADDPTASKEWLDSVFGDCINVHPVGEIHQLQPGDLYYQLQWINCKPATTSVIIELLDENDQPVVGDTVIFGWPSAEPHGYEGRPWNWTVHGATGGTDEQGIVGPVMSEDAYYSPDLGECGVFFLWIWDLPSEMVDGVGMLPFHDLVPGANHLHTEYGFKLVRYGEEPPEPPEPPEDGALDKILAAVLRLDANVAEMLEILDEGYVPPDDPPDPEPEVFKVELFNNEDLAGPPIYTMEEAQPFWHEGDWLDRLPGVNVDHVSGRWSGSFMFGAGTCTFNILTDDGARLWIDGELILDKWYPMASTPFAVNITLTAGLHEVVLEWFEQAGGATLHFNWA